MKRSPFSLVTSDKLLVFGGLAYRNQTPGLLCRNSVSQCPQVNVQMGFPKDYRTWWSNMCPKVPCCPIQNPVYVQTSLISLQSVIFLDLSLNFFLHGHGFYSRIRHKPLKTWLWKMMIQKLVGDRENIFLDKKTLEDRHHRAFLCEVFAAPSQIKYAVKARNVCLTCLEP